MAEKSDLKNKSLAEIESDAGPMFTNVVAVLTPDEMAQLRQLEKEEKWEEYSQLSNRFVKAHREADKAVTVS